MKRAAITKTRFLVLCILSSYICVSAIAQLRVRNGVVLADYLTIKFKVPVVNVPAGQSRATAADIKASMQHISSFFARFGAGVDLKK